MSDKTFPPDVLKNSVTDGPDARKIFVLKEKNKIYKAINKNRIFGACIQIDNNLIAGTETKKCDKALCLFDKRIYLVELKGVDLNTACKQLKVTYEYLKPLMKDYDFYCRIVVKDMPSKGNLPSSYRTLKAILPKDNKYLKSESTLLEETI